MEHHFRDAAGEEDADGGVADGAVGQGVDEAGDLAVDVDPVLDGGAAQAGGVGDGGDVEEEVGGAAEGGMDDHGVVDGIGGEDLLEGDAALLKLGEGGGGAGGHVEPDGLAGRSEGGVGEGHAERFADDLGGGGGAEELTAAAGGGAGAAAQFGGFLQGEGALGEADADGLDFAGVFAVFGWEGDAAGDEDGGEIAASGEGHHHGGEAFVAGGDAHDAAAAREGADEAAEDDGGVVAVGEGIHHAGGALGAAVAGIGAEAGEGDRCLDA